MSTPSTEATGSRRGPPSTPPLTTPQQVRVKIDCLLDCTRRALDGLAVDADHQPNWTYVAGQLNAAAHFANQAEELATCAVMEDTPVVAQPIDADQEILWPTSAALNTPKQAQGGES